MDWTKFPDLIAVGLLTWAFASVVRKSHAPVSDHWLHGWVLILLHFTLFLFLPSPGRWGIGAALGGILCLVWAGILFMRASVPYRAERSSRAMLILLLACYTVYVSALQLNAPMGLQMIAAGILGVAPLALALYAVPSLNHPLRWMTIGLQCTLAAFLVLIHHRADYADLALDAVLLTVYLGCALHFTYMYRRGTAGALITITGFFLWAAVFLVAPLVAAYAPHVQVENEVWNLPKFVVAVGMILLLLEDQIAHNKHLALHDELTGLPNRRLFLDRLAGALERARRHNSQTALLMLDLDHFKQVNDTLGHHTGDLLLQNVAELFSRRVRRSDTVARTGGDEFAIILDSPTSYAEASHVGRALLEMLDEPMRLKDREVRVGASLGVAIFPDDAADMEALCIAADLRMYDDKRENAANSVTASLGEPLTSGQSSRRPHDSGMD